MTEYPPPILPPGEGDEARPPKTSRTPQGPAYPGPAAPPADVPPPGQAAHGQEAGPDEPQRLLPPPVPPRVKPRPVARPQVSLPSAHEVAGPLPTGPLPAGSLPTGPPPNFPPPPATPPTTPPRVIAAAPPPGPVGSGRPAAPPPPAPLVAAAPGPISPQRFTGTPVGPSGSPELLRQAMTRRQEAPAQKGWRKAVRSLTGGRMNPSPGAAELAARAELEELRRPFNRPMTIMVANPKGGAGKTPTSLMLGATLGRVRGGYVLSWDNNETRGTLGLRAHQFRHEAGVSTTVWDLLSVLDTFETVDASVGALSRFVRPQETLFDVLASDEDAARMAQIGREEVRRLHKLLARFYRILIVDTGNNLRAPNWQAISELADALVVVSTYEWDTAYSASWMLDHLCAQGRGDLVARAVTVLTSTDRRVEVSTRDELIRAFDRTAAVVEIPYDPALRGGGEISYAAQSPATLAAWNALAAAICRQLAVVDNSPLPEIAPSTPIIGGVPLGHRGVRSAEYQQAVAAVAHPAPEPVVAAVAAPPAAVPPPAPAVPPPAPAVAAATPAKAPRKAPARAPKAQPAKEPQSSPKVSPGRIGPVIHPDLSGAVDVRLAPAGVRR